MNAIYLLFIYSGSVDTLPLELLSLACSLLGTVSFCSKQQYQEACQMHLHLLSSKDDLEYIKHVVMTG